MASIVWHRLFTVCVSAALCAVASAAERAATCRVQEGETIRDVAARVLGSPDLAEELLQLNQVGDSARLTPGTLLALPGPEREEALQRLKAAAAKLEEAVARGATQLCGPELEAARRTLRLAEEARASASYSKAIAQAGVAAAQAQEAGELAERRSSVAEFAKVTAVQGGLLRKAEAGEWGELKAGGSVAGADRLRTADGARVDLALPDGSVIRLGPASELSVRELLRDQRTGVRKLSLQLIAGELAARTAAGPHARLEISSVPAALVASGAEFEVVRSAAGDTLVATKAGSVQAAAGARSATVPAGSALRISRDGDVGAVRALPAAPRLAEPWPAGVTTGVSRVVMSWKAVAGAASYQLQVARDVGLRDTGYGSSIHEDAVSDLTAVTPVLPVGGYFWRVRARTGDGFAGPWSDSGCFQTVFDLQAKAEGQGTSVKCGGRTVFAPGVQVQPVAANPATSIVRFEMQAADGAWKPYERAATLAAGGRYTVRFRGVAPDGRTGDPAETTIEVDDLPPGLRIQFGAPERVKGRVTMKVKLDADDSSGVSDLACRVKGRGWSGSSDFQPCAKDLVLEQPGRYTIEARARDALGNESLTTAECTVPQ